MAAIAATDFTVTQVRKFELGRSSKTGTFDLAFGDGSLTYPASGIPMPSLSQLGFRRNIDDVVIVDPANANGFVYKYDKANHKLRIYTQGAVVGAAGSETLDDFPVTAGVGVTADTHLSLKAGAGTVRWGGLKELATGDTPAATTLRVVVTGW
jgi:hypothetical protein